MSPITALLVLGCLQPNAHAGAVKRILEEGARAREALAREEGWDHIEEDGDPQDESADGVAEGERPPSALPLELRSDASPVQVLHKQELRWLKPKAGRLPPNPETSTDFTAHTLKSGEVKVGLLSTAVGLSDNFQVGTMPLLYSAGLPNVALKVEAIQAGRFHLAFSGSRHWLTQPTFSASYTGIGAATSLRLTPAWSIHGGATYGTLLASGTPDLCAMSGLLTGAPCESEVDSSSSTAGLGLQDRVHANVVWARVATDIRFNRRDSLILQASAIPWARMQVDPSIDVPDIAGLKAVLAHDGPVPLDTLYTASVAWQFAWKHTHLRVGIGSAALPLAWVTQTTELSVRLGGKDRRDRSKQQRTWRMNRRDLNRDLDRGGEPVDEEAPGEDAVVLGQVSDRG